MFPYWLLFTLFAAGAVQYYRTAPLGRHTAPLLGVMALVPVAIIGFRYQTGADWQPYLYIFEEISYLEFGQMLAIDDPGYNFVNWAASALGVQIWAVNLVCAAVFCWGLVVFCKEQPNPWLAFVVAIPYLVIVVAIGYTRQAVAIGLIMAAMVAWDRKRILRFGMFILIAATFHKTAVLALPLMAMSATRNRMVTAAVVLLFGFVLYRFFLVESVDRMLTNYVEAEYSSQGAAVRVAMNLVPAILYLLFHRRFELTEGQRRMWRYFSLAALATVAMLVLLPSSTAVDRIALYLIPLQLFVFSRLPSVFSNGGRPNGQITALVLGYSAMIQFVWLNYANHAEYWVPYKFWPITEEADTRPSPEGL